MKIQQKVRWLVEMSRLKWQTQPNLYLDASWLLNHPGVLFDQLSLVPCRSLIDHTDFDTYLIIWIKFCVLCSWLPLPSYYMQVKNQLWLQGIFILYKHWHLVSNWSAHRIGIFVWLMNGPQGTNNNWSNNTPVKSSPLGSGGYDLNLQGCVSLCAHPLRFNKRQEFISRGEK